ncbi:oxidoreductase [Mesorhizobium sp. WSM4884]|uniref:oxidoreductase n=1 Tax=Mesorhizobium sp. WSM4884 TaxID=3038542 RepID=UPI002416F7C3|nr:oxidoreductase [Mesorhizobium sp. WSM4884]MDG4884010.1 oxidoreductase [Mesorhizobium sp. WSM4884]
MVDQHRKQRVWFVTGASSGFGRAVSEAVLDRGDRLVATARHVDAIRGFARRGGDRALALPLDVTSATAAKETVDEAVAHFGRLDVIFNNAGYGHVGAIEELTEEELRQQVEVDFFGVVNVTRAALPHLRRLRSGHFVQMSSLNGVEPLPGGAFYSAAKFAVEGFSEALAGEVAHLGIKVIIVEPAPFRTRFLSGESARWSRPMGDYEASVGQVRQTLKQMDGNQPGDPARAAQAIIEVVEAENPPLRLPLGQIAVDHIRAALDAEARELDAWAHVSTSVDFPRANANLSA